MITVRLCSGKRVQRRFLKQDSVQKLYDYVKTIPHETMGFEEEGSKF